MSTRATLITGGAGFIGSHLAERLLERGHRVVVYDNFDPYYERSVKERNVREASASQAYRLVEGDIRDAASLDALFREERFETVVHLAARAGVRPSIEDPVLYSSVNLDGTTRLLEAARQHGVERFVFGSSSSVYGNNDKVPFAEDDAVDHPISPYAATKRSGELIAHTFHHLFGLKVSCLRFFTVYGPRQRPEMAIHKFTRMIDAGESVPMFGDGATARDYTFVADIVSGIERAIERTEAFHIWNLGGSRTIRLSELIDKIAGALGKEAIIDRQPTQPGDVERTWADVQRCKRELDWEAQVTIDEGLDRFVRWFRHEGGGESA